MILSSSFNTKQWWERPHTILNELSNSLHFHSPRKPIHLGIKLHENYPRWVPLTPYFCKAYTQNPHDPSYTTTETKATSFPGKSFDIKMHKELKWTGDEHPFLWVKLLHLSFLMEKGFFYSQLWLYITHSFLLQLSWLQKSS